MPNALELSKQISALSDDYYKASLEAGEISMREGTAWLELRAICKTDAETRHKWSVTADGKRMNYLKFYLKGLERKISALKMELRIMTGLGA